METSHIIQVGTEYVAATERINTALATLRRELTAMREQDLKLLRQLIHINETIRRLSSGRRALHERSSSCAIRLNSSLNGYSTLPVRKPPLLRQQSEPRFCVEEKHLSRASSTSSEQDTLDSQEDIVYSSGSELEDSTSSLRLLKQKFRPRSFSFVSAVSFPVDGLTGGDSTYNEILKRNIRLWKWSQAQDDHVFEEEAPSQVDTEAER
ncbi:uncharacterized protein [Haliotis asinina]|uniref:uncharacterized protein n=1 Tax=Haliotis asinina TaxID=109174 RepID=UPI00353229C8